MAGIAKIAWRAVPPAALTAVAFMAQVGPHDAKAHIVEWWEKTGFPAPAFLQHPHVDAQVTTICVALVAVWMLGWWALHRRESSFDHVNDWSVSVDLGCMASANENTKLLRYVRDMCRFVNLSTTQARVIDIVMTIPYFDRSKRPVTLSATRRPPITDIRIGPVLPDRYDPILTFPIRIEPNGVVEGRIEFALPDGGVEADDLDVFKASAIVSEARSQQSRRLGTNEVYDARERRSYAGRLGKPRPVWGPRLQRWKNWVLGRRPPRQMTLSELYGEAKLQAGERRLGAQITLRDSNEG